jgi:chemotaxis signal transduction protein
MNASATANDTPLPPEWREEWSREIARPLDAGIAAESVAMLVFRLGAERFALPVEAVVEIGPMPTMHRLPTRAATEVGLVNVRGRVTVCASFVPLLQPLGETGSADARLVVLQSDKWLFATRVDAIDGVHRLDLRALLPPPPPSHTGRFTTGLWTLAGHTIARLDHPRLFAALKESLA